jgi:hypothetical protein
MDVGAVELELKKLGYEIKKIQGNNIDFIAADRVGALQDLATKFRGKYNPAGGSSSIGRTELPGGVKLNAKPKGGGSGAGSDVTAAAESLQCLYCALHFNGEPFVFRNLGKVRRYFKVDAKLKAMEALPEDWYLSCMTTAKILKQKFPRGKYQFHRGSRWVSTLENHWKKLNRDEKLFSNLNKWSPADIYMVSPTGANIDFTKANNILELNNMMLDAINNGDVIGVSLKKVGSSGTYSLKNVTDERPTYKYEGVTIGKKGFFNSQDSYLRYEGGEIQFRKFGSTWQGEIKGKTANMGKISGGPINALMAKNGIVLIPQADVKEKNDELMDKFFDYYKHFKGDLDRKTFEAAVAGQDFNWWVSKFLSAQLAYEIDKASSATQEKIVSAMLSYASSQSDLSGPYAKVE